MSESNFSRFSLQPFLIQAIKDVGFSEPTPIQERIIPKALNGLSVVGQSQTGTGKTHAFLLPILSKINPRKQEVQAVITTPTRELASQIYHEILKLTKHCADTEQITTRLFVGGTDKSRVIERLKNQPHIVVGTPGRIFDLVKEQALFVHTSEMLVVDEADLMLDMGFLEDVDKIASTMPQNLQMFVFSATIPENLRPFLKKYMENPEFIQVEPKRKTAENIEHILIPLRHRNKLDVLINLIHVFNPYLAIVFANTKVMADKLTDDLVSKGIKVGIIHGDLSPRERKQMMNRIRNLEFQYIVATDLASRGIDIEGVSHVIHYEIPNDLNFYIHRAGRTGRAQFSGISAVLYDTADEQKIAKLESMNIVFKHMDIVNGSLQEVKHRNQRKTRRKTEKLTDPSLSYQIRKPKKVKPGYKKKMRAEMEALQRKQRRKRK